MVMRHARAAFDIAREKNKLDEWQTDLEQVASLTADSDVLAFLEDPKIHIKIKADLLAGQLEGIDPIIINLVYLLIEKGRMAMIGDMVIEYRRLLESHRSIERAEVITAAPISKVNLTKLKERLSEVVGKEIVLKTKIDPELISGMVARVGDKVIDGCTRNQLALLRRELRKRGD
jgi:F-type H+-transporting ATPase subunit delta